MTDAKTIFERKLALSNANLEFLRLVLLRVKMEWFKVSRGQGAPLTCLHEVAWEDAGLASQLCKNRPLQICRHLSRDR